MNSISFFIVYWMDLLINFVPIYEVFKPKERSIFVICKTSLGLILWSLVSITLSNLSFKTNSIILNLCKQFKIRKKDAETNEVIITIGSHLATEQVFQSEEEAQKVIDATDWNLVAALIYACKEADQWEEKQKETTKKEEE